MCCETTWRGTQCLNKWRREESRDCKWNINSLKSVSFVSYEEGLRKPEIHQIKIEPNTQLRKELFKRNVLYEIGIFNGACKFLYFISRLQRNKYHEQLLWSSLRSVVNYVRRLIHAHTCSYHLYIIIKRMRSNMTGWAMIIFRAINFNIAIS